MRWPRIFGCAVSAGWLLLLCPASGQEVAQKKRVAVLNFDNPSVGSETPSGLFGADVEDVGKGVSARIIQKLLQGGKYTVVDRYALEDLLKEQKDVDSDHADAYGSAARVGRLLGLDAMIIGAITRYGPDDKHKGAGGVVFPSGVHTRKSKAFVEITARVFNVSTGEVIAEFRGAGESAQPGEIAIIRARGQSEASTEILSSDFAESLLVEATSNAVEQIAAQLNLFADKIPALRIATEGLVAEVVGNMLTLNIGKKTGIKVGDHLEVLRPAAVAESASPKAPQRVMERVGVVTVTEVADHYATAMFSGPGQAQVGDQVRGVDNSRALPH
jgi:curli biogenesis system outer membrane secretion channel CsgG